ncbi:MAG: hypothetical protein EXR76_03985 [Myxococcales bacterium]|nr:hypothetical protein [Myxococcales bacterium]
MSPPSAGADRLLDLLYPEGKTEAQLQVLRREVEADPELRAQLRDYERVRALVSHLPDLTPDHHVRSALLRAARTRSEPSGSGAFWAWLSASLSGPTLAGAMGLLLAVGGAVLLNSESSDDLIPAAAPAALQPEASNGVAPAVVAASSTSAEPPAAAGLMAEDAKKDTAWPRSGGEAPGDADTKSAATLGAVGKKGTSSARGTLDSDGVVYGAMGSSAESESESERDSAAKSPPAKRAKNVEALEEKSAPSKPEVQRDDPLIQDDKRPAAPANDEIAPNDENQMQRAFAPPPPQESPAEDKTPMLLAEARSLRRTGRVAQAITIYEQLTRTATSLVARAEARLELSRSLRESGSLRPAAASYELFLSGFPGHPDAQVVLFETAEIYERLGNLVRAAVLYQQVVQAEGPLSTRAADRLTALESASQYKSKASPADADPSGSTPSQGSRPADPKL